MLNIKNVFRFIPRRYRWYACVICFIYILIFLHYSRPSVHLQEESSITNDSITFDLYDDDDAYLHCPLDTKFNISNRHHLAIIVSSKLEIYVWKNFRSLLCTGIDVYVMLDEVFDIDSSSRGDGFKPRKDRSKRSYTHRFLYISNELLETYGVSYMSKFPTIQYSVWDRVIVWLYNREHLTNAWILDQGVQWLYAGNLTHLFDAFTSDETDILCADIIATDASFWMHWPKNDSDILPKSLWLGSYSPLVRWSRRLLLHHYKYMQLIHKNRLRYDIHQDFRFKEFIMTTIANIEGLPVGLFNKKHRFIELSLGQYNDTSILSLLREGKHIIYPVLHDSILTTYRLKEIGQMISDNSLIINANQNKTQ